MRVSCLGSSASEQDMQSWRATLKRAFPQTRKADMESPEAKARIAKRRANISKLATWCWLLAMDSAMNDSLGHGLEWYLPAVADRPFNDDLHDNEEDTDNILVYCSDEEQKQLAGYYYLERGLKLICVRHQPPLHRRRNFSPMPS